MPNWKWKPRRRATMRNDSGLGAETLAFTWRRNRRDRRCENLGKRRHVRYYVSYRWESDEVESMRITPWFWVGEIWISRIYITLDAPL